MKEKYESPRAEIDKFEIQDVICTSGEGSITTEPAGCRESWDSYDNIWYF